MTTTGCFMVSTVWTKRRLLQKLTKSSAAFVLLTPADLSPLAAGRLAQSRAISRSASSLSREYSETDIVRHEQGRNREGRDPIGSAHVKARLEKVGQDDRDDQVQHTENVEHPEHRLGGLEITEGEWNRQKGQQAAIKSPIAAGQANCAGMPG